MTPSNNSYPHKLNREELIEALVEKGYRRELVVAFVEREYPDGAVAVIKYVAPQDVEL